MGISDPPNIEELKASKNVKGLIKVLKDEDEVVRLQIEGALRKIRK
jgi:HEAT repeat protein